MTLTVQRIGQFLRRRLDGEPSMDTLSLCNLAGRQLFTMHTWEWAVAPKTTITINSGKSEVELPKDFGRMVKVETSGSLLNALVLTTPSHLLELETSIISMNNVGYWAAVVWKKPTDGCPMRPVLRVYPQIGTSDSLNLYYYSAWVEITDENETISVPPFIEPLLLELCFAFAQGYDEHDIADLNDRLARVQQSPVFQTAVMQDASVQDELGEIRGGVTDSNRMWQSATIIGGPYQV
jgi:hypothetical protein